MVLWIEWFRCVHELRSACSRHVTFAWMALVLAGMAIRLDLLGVTSFVRGSFLDPFCTGSKITARAKDTVPSCPIHPHRVAIGRSAHSVQCSSTGVAANS